LRKLGINVTADTRRGALQLISGDAAYVVHGAFNPEGTLQIFNDAIEQAYTDGFTGFRLKCRGHSIARMERSRSSCTKRC
jgi:hypothetical protein